MEWRDNKIWIVEYPGTLHTAAAAAMILAMASATGSADNHLTAFTDSRNRQAPRGEANTEQDCAFGPRRNVGARLPQGVASWSEFHTVKVEIGVAQSWPRLNRKATGWKGRAGVNFVLCIKLSVDRQTGEYRFEERVDGRFPGGDDEDRAAILPIDVNSILKFDARRLLGLPDNAALPKDFNDPVRMNLFRKVEQLFRQHAEDEDGVNDDRGGGQDEVWSCSIPQLSASDTGQTSAINKLLMTTCLQSSCSCLITLNGNLGLKE